MTPEGEVARVDPGAPGDLAASSGILPWHELARHFARGVVVVVSPGLDLVAVADTMAADDAVGVAALLDEGTVARASDDDARAWVASEPSFRCIVVAPWVLVQPLH